MTILHKPIEERNIIIIGLGRHGKDTVAEICRDLYKLKFKSSSEMCNELFIYDKLKKKYNYKSKQECFNDRHSHRIEWFNLIVEFNKKDKTKLAKEIFKVNNIYVGLRNKEELTAIKLAGIVDHIVWVDARKRLGITENIKSMTLLECNADYTIDNNGTVFELKCNVFWWLKCISTKLGTLHELSQK